MMRRILVIVVLWAFVVGAPAEARQDDPRLDALFEQLLAADDLAASRRRGHDLAHLDRIGQRDDR